MQGSSGKRGFIMAMVAAMSFAFFVAGGVWIVLDLKPMEAETFAQVPQRLNTKMKDWLCRPSAALPLEASPKKIQ